MARGGARPGAGRPTLYPRTIRASIRLSEDEVRMIEECIEKLGTNRSDIISKEIVNEFYKIIKQEIFFKKKTLTIYQKTEKLLDNLSMIKVAIENKKLYGKR